MLKIRMQFVGAIMGTVLSISGAGGGCDMNTLNSLNSLADTLDSFESSDYGYYDTYESYDSYDYGSSPWNEDSYGYDILDVKSG